METAIFVRRPTRVDDLIILPLRPRRFYTKPYEIIATVRVGAIEYDNFADGMDVDRAFLEEHATKCTLGDVYHCVLVKGRRRKGGILVVPDLEGFVIMAAYLPPASVTEPHG